MQLLLQSQKCQHLVSSIVMVAHAHQKRGNVSWGTLHEHIGIILHCDWTWIAVLGVS